MSILVPFNGSNYIIPTPGETGWGSNLDSFFVAIGAGCLQKIGGSFLLASEVDFGASFGLKSLYYKSRATGVAATGAIRLANAETGIVWRNFLGSGDLPLTVNASNQLTFNGTPIGGSGIFTASRAIVSDSSGNLTSATTTATEIGYVSGVTSAIQTQLNGKALNGDVTASLLTQSTNRLLGRTTSSTGAIEEISVGAGLTFATGSLVNAGVTALTGTANQVNVTASTGSITLSTPQDIATSSTPTFASETLAATTNQLILGATRTVTLTAPTPASTSRTVTIPDLSASYSIVGTEGTQTINGSKTFSGTIASTQTGTIISNNITSASDSIIQFQNSGSGGVNLRLFHGADDTSDTWLQMLVGTGPTYWSTGIDNSDSDKWKLSQSSALGTNDALTFNTSLQVANDLSFASSKKVILTDNSINTVSLKATNSTTSYTLSFPTTAGTNGFTLTTDGSGNTSWTPAGSGTVSSGTAGRLTLYGTSAAVVTDTYVQNTHNITLAIATQASRSADLAITIPNPGNAVTSANLLLDSDTGSYTIAGAWTLSNSAGLTISPTSNQIVLGATRTVTLTAPTPATSSRTWTIPDITGNGTFAALEGTQTFSGTKTFSADVTITSATTTALNIVSSVASAGGLAAFMHNTGAGGAATASMYLQSDNGDAFFRVRTTPSGTVDWVWGSDQSSSGNFTLNTGTALVTGASLIASASSGAVSIQGTATNNSASAGYVGEYVESVISSPTNFPSTGTFGDLTSITLTAGDWDVTAMMDATKNGATTTEIGAGISSTSGNSGTGLVAGINFMRSAGPTAVNRDGVTVASYRASLSGTVTHYLKYTADFSVATPQATGRLSARRMR